MGARVGTLGRVIVRGTRALWLSLWTIAVLSAPRLASACSVCTAGRDEENQAAFLWSTLFMSLLPLIAIGSIIFFIWKRVQKLEEQEEQRGLTRAPHAVRSAAADSPSLSR